MNGGARPERGLDFVVIGAQKSATTSLHHWLLDHPQLTLPPEKEAPFFDRLPTPTRGDYTAYLRDTFGSRPGLRGTATPQYMCFDWAAEPMAELAPQARLIALLRDPVDRARSHWTMRARIGSETRPFDAAIADLLAARGNPLREEDGYIAFGEYGRILSRYVQHFPREALLVAYDTEAAASPQGLLDRVTDHLGVARHAPRARFATRFNSSPTRQRAREKVLWSVVPYRRLQRALPMRTRQRLGAALDRMDLARPIEDLDPALRPATEHALREHFRADADLLAPLLASPPYWLARWAAQPPAAS